MILVDMFHMYTNIYKFKQSLDETIRIQKRAHELVAHYEFDYFICHPL